MDDLELPPRDSPDLHLAVATADELTVQQHANCHEWRGALSPEAYMRREEYLNSRELTLHGGMIPWMLVYQPSPSLPRRVLCGCETIRKRALVGRNGKAEDVVCYGVGSVFCPPKYRGRGYAGRMMRELGERLDDLQTPQGMTCAFSVLFSDIGKDFYAAHGWHPFPSAHLTLSPSTNHADGQFRLLTSSDLPELCAVDESLVRKRLSARADDNRFAVAIVPNLQIIEWHHAREEFVSNEIYSRTPMIKGAIVGDAPGPRIWAIWSRIWSSPGGDTPSTLHILRLVIEDDDCLQDGKPTSFDADVVRAISTIFRVAQSEALLWELNEVCLWNPTSEMLAAARSVDSNVEIVHREAESITSLRWYGSAGSWQDVDWLENQKFGWN